MHHNPKGPLGRSGGRRRHAEDLGGDGRSRTRCSAAGAGDGSRVDVPVGATDRRARRPVDPSWRPGQGAPSGTGERHLSRSDEHVHRRLVGDGQFGPGDLPRLPVALHAAAVRVVQRHLSGGFGSDDDRRRSDRGPQPKVQGGRRRRVWHFGRVQARTAGRPQRADSRVGRAVHRSGREGGPQRTARRADLAQL